MTESLEEMCFFLRFNWQSIVGEVGWINFRRWQKSIADRLNQHSSIVESGMEIRAADEVTTASPKTDCIFDPISGRPMLKIDGVNALDGLADLADNSIHCAAFSWPYWLKKVYGAPGEWGRESTLNEHLENLVRFFRLLKRKLHPQGTVWLNYGDGTAQNGNPATPEEREKNRERVKRKGYPTDAFAGTPNWDRSAGSARGSGLAPKQLLMLPARVALAVQADGWWLRQQIVWHKRGANAQSPHDRPAPKHEDVFLFSKQPRYFYDVWAVRNNMRVTSEGWIYGTQLGSVWEITSTSSRAGHPAVWPIEIPRRSILLGSSHLGCCPACLSPVVPIYERGQAELEDQIRCGSDRTGQYHGKSKRDYSKTGCQDPSDVKRRRLESLRPARVIGGKSTCRCLSKLEDAVPCTVLDPFSGEGTTLRAALLLGRFAQGFELHPAWCQWSKNDLQPLAQQWATLRKDPQSGLRK